MATGRAPVTTSEIVAIAVATLDDLEKLAQFIDTAPADRIPLIVIRAGAARKWLQKLETFGEQRIARDKIVLFGAETVDTDTGVIYEFRGELGERKITNPAELRKRLLAAGADSAAVARSIFDEIKVSFTELNKIAQTSRAYAEIIEDHEAERKFRPPHLVAKE